VGADGLQLTIPTKAFLTERSVTSSFCNSNYTPMIERRQIKQHTTHAYAGWINTTVISPTANIFSYLQTISRSTVAYLRSVFSGIGTPPHRRCDVNGPLPHNTCPAICPVNLFFTARTVVDRLPLWIA
jgi:hypothetical protein